jgi:hypothetical protein
MRCYICNAILTPSEINWNSKHNDWDPCTRCLEEIDRQLSFEFMNDEEEGEEEEDNDHGTRGPC